MSAGAAPAAPTPSAIRPALVDLVALRVRLRLRIARGDNATTSELAGTERALAGTAGAQLSRLADLFKLSVVDRDVLQACLAVAADPDLAGELRAACGRPYVTATLVADLFGHARGRVWNPGGPLAIWELVAADAVAPGEPEVLAIDPVVSGWLGGELWIDRELAGSVRLIKQGLRLPSWPVEGAAEKVKHALGIGAPIRVMVCGDAGSGRTMFAAAAAAASGVPPLVVDTTDLGDEAWARTYVRLQRIAAVGGLALVWTGAHVARPWPTLVSPAPVHFVVVEPGAQPRPHPGVVTEAVTVPEPTIAERRWVWTKTLAAARTWREEDLDALARRHRLGVGDIATIAAAAPPTVEDAASAARLCRRGTDDDVVETIACPYAWDDLVLPPNLKQALEELTFEATEREAVQEDVSAQSRWLSREGGLVALFCGPSGCGKTMAAQVIAARLGLELLRVNLAAVLSKYIGETAKNMNRIFGVARRRQAVLLFDEADAHLARRTEVKDAHDRYANADTNHLLQLLESYRGVVILATNRRSDLDAAFVRRVRHVLDFPRPHAAERFALWRRAIAAVAPKQWKNLSKPLRQAADAVDVTGAQIKGAATTALFLARRDKTSIGIEHLRRGIDRELANEGRPPSQGWSHA